MILLYRKVNFEKGAYASNSMVSMHGYDRNGFEFEPRAFFGRRKGWESLNGFTRNVNLSSY